MGLFTPSLANLAITSILFSLYVVGLYIYRAFFDSLSHIPGSKLAAATLWVEYYYDVVKKGRYTWEIAKMHRRYGPVVRISPYEVHIHDPEFIDQVYPGSSVRNEPYAWAMKMFGIRHAFLVTLDHDLHRIRRSAFACYLSKASIQRLEPCIQSVIDRMVSRLQEIKGSGKVINLVDVFGCLTGDIIGQYAFASPYGFLEDPDFSPHWHRIMMAISINAHLLKHFGFLMPLMQLMPEWLVKMTTPGMMILIDLRKGIRNQVIKAKQDIAEGRKPTGQSNIFYDVLSNPSVRLQEKSTSYLQDEAQVFIQAGTFTTAHTLTLATYHIIANPSIRQKLQSELADLMTTHTNPTWSQLESLPYLTATITEALRMAYGASHRLQRLFPDTVLQHGEISIPRSTPVSMTSVLIHDDPSLFPEPQVFKPERFLDHPELKRYLVSFSRGSRACAGINLAYAELYLGMAAVWAPGRFGWELWETDGSDVEVRHDFFAPSPRLESKGVRVLVN